MGTLLVMQEVGRVTGPAEYEVRHMTVSRRDDHEDRGHEPLGRVLVTIDDLEALITLIRENSTDEAAPPKMKFSGGTFTEPSDLRVLTDDEYEDIEIINSKIEVNLNSYFASAAGDPKLASLIQTAWARKRRTSKLPKYREREAWIERVIVAIVGVLGVLATTVLAIIRTESLKWAWGIPALMIVAVLARIAVKKRARRWDSYALMVPLSLDEYRKLAGEQNRHLKSWIVALSATVIALIGVVVTLLVNTILK
jgi:hypothetical protein